MIVTVCNHYLVFSGQCEQRAIHETDFMFKHIPQRSFWKPYLFKIKLELTKCLHAGCHKSLKPLAANLENFVRLYILEASLIKTFWFCIINLFVCVFALIQNLLKSIRVTV